MLTIDELKHAVTYNPETGVFRRIAHGKLYAWRDGKEITTTDSHGYIVFKVGRQMVKAHRAAWLYVTGEWPAGYLDHINRVRNDNRFCNLRLATPVLNSQNRKRSKANTSGVTGVSFIQCEGKWRASIGIGGKAVSLGHYHTREEAAAARAAKMAELIALAQWPLPS